MSQLHAANTPSMSRNQFSESTSPAATSLPLAAVDRSHQDSQISGPAPAARMPHSLADATYASRNFIRISRGMAEILDSMHSLTIQKETGPTSRTYISARASIHERLLQAFTHL
jgi:hypothetical protein